jgi:hypothetical protein
MLEVWSCRGKSSSLTLPFRFVKQFLFDMCFFLREGLILHSAAEGIVWNVVVPCACSERGEVIDGGFCLLQTGLGSIVYRTSFRGLFATDSRSLHVCHLDELSTELAPLVP